MRFLLLLSALFAAFVGVTATRVQAQPVQASAVAPMPAIAAEARTPLAIRQVGAAFGRAPPVQAPLPRIAGAVTAYPLYAERRRE